MSTENNVQIVQNFLAALGRRDKQDLLALSAEDIDGAYCRCSSEIRYRVTTVLLKANRGSEQYQLMNSRIA
jgi:hypothetical protein